MQLVKCQVFLGLALTCLLSIYQSIEEACFLHFHIKMDGNNVVRNVCSYFRVNRTSYIRRRLQFSTDVSLVQQNIAVFLSLQEVTKIWIAKLFYEKNLMNLLATKSHNFDKRNKKSNFCKYSHTVAVSARPACCKKLYRPLTIWVASF